MEGTLLPGQEVVVSISVMVDHQSAALLNTGEETLEDIIVLHIKGGKDCFISIFGKYVPTCFGNEYTTLLRLPQPIRSIPRERFTELLLPPERSISVAREIFRMIDWLANEEGGAGESRLIDGLFVKEGDSDAVEYIREVSLIRLLCVVRRVVMERFGTDAELLERFRSNSA